MTTEDIQLAVGISTDGNVILAVTRESDNTTAFSITISPETAREAAQRLTLASWEAEEGH